MHQGSHSYDASAGAAHEPLTASDVAHLLATDGAGAVGSPARMRTLLQRVGATLDAHALTVADLHRSVADVSEAARRAASPMGAALAALGALDEAGQRAVYDMRAGALLDVVDVASAAADRALAAARNESLRNRFILGSLMESAALDEATKKVLHAAMTSLVAEGAPMVTLDTTRLSELVADAVTGGGFTVAPMVPEPDPVSPSAPGGWDDVFGDPDPAAPWAPAP